MVDIFLFLFPFQKIVESATFYTDMLAGEATKAASRYDGLAMVQVNIRFPFSYLTMKACHKFFFQKTQLSHT